ncbi:hypothetical protein SLS56_005811 [Neofusicoccum ribis]|uniref:C6 zinc finger domain protein n=1 Tax=Neofusicoccum ribis TaxID=45134 RepID=A0ABR3SSJ3_9PEZI
MSLLYYYTVHTSLTLAALPQIVEIYTLVAPKIAFSDPSLLLCMLAIAALHRAHVDSTPERQEEYVRQAVEYQNRSIGMLRAQLANITPENCVGTFLSSSFLLIYTFASEPWLRYFSSGTPSEGCLDDVTRSLRLLRGVPSILGHDNNAVFGWIMESPLRPIADGILHKPKGRFTPEQESHFAALRYFLIEDQNAGEEERRVCLEALHVLREYAELLLDRQAQQQIETVGLTMTWPVAVSERYLAYLESHRRGALLVLAEYAVLFRRLRRYWWADAWGQMLLTVTLELLPADWRCSILQFHDESLNQLDAAVRGRRSCDGL